MDHLSPLIRRHIDQARADGTEHLDLSARKLGLHLSVLLDLLVELDPNGDSQLPALRSIDLSSNGLESLPREVERLAGLAYLDIRRNPIRRLPDVPLPSLIIDTRQWRQLRDQLEDRTIFGLQILPEGLHGDIDFFSEIERRGILRLSLIRVLKGRIPDALWRLKQLTHLDLSHNQLSALPESIGRLQRLTCLDLSRNLLSNLPESTGQLQQLTNLDLIGNRLSELPESIGRLQQLTCLDLSYNQLSELPESIGRLQRLTRLDLSYNQLSELLESIDRLRQLIRLDLRHNQLLELPGSIGQLRQLIRLDLSYNRLSELPESIGQLQRLTRFDLSFNRLSELPDGIGDLKDLRELELDGNPLSDSLTAAVRSGPGAVLAYLRAKAARLYEAKLLIVGEAGAGKTTLARKLLDPVAQLPGEDESTLGINVYRDWRFPYAPTNRIEAKAIDPPSPQPSPKGRGSQQGMTCEFLSNSQASEQAQEMSANIWDFGGQEIQYATHQFFLTPNALYVLVVDVRRQETDYDYWLKIIRLLGQDSASGRKTQVLVLLHEKANRQVTDFDLGAYRRRFPQLVIETAEADLANLADGRIENLRIRIQQLLSKLPHVGERQPAAWRPIRAAVEERQAEHHLSFERFRALCTEHGIDQEEAARVLVRYLSFVGSCVYFDRDPLLKDFIITDPQWAVNALYRVLDRDEVQNRRGRLRRRFFYEVLAAEGYQEYEIDRLFRLLQKDQFEICFPLEGSDGELHIVPQLIPTIRPEYDWEDRDNLHFEYQYPFMPKGLLARLIVRLHELLEVGNDDQPLIWRKGAILSSEGARAELVETEDPRGGKVLRLRVAGRMAQRTMARRQLLAVLRYEIEQTHFRSFRGLEVNERVPCSCKVCGKAAEPRMYDYSELEKYVSGGRGTVYCPEGQVDVSISAMLEGLVGTAAARPPALSSGTAGAGNELDRLSDRDYSTLERLRSEALRVEVSPTLNVQVSPEVSVRQETTVSIEMRIEQKNQVCNALGGLLDNLAEDAEASDVDPAELKRLKTELDKAQGALKKLEDNQDLDDKQKVRGPLQRLKNLVDKIADAQTSLGKLVKAVAGSAETAHMAIELYNKLAPLFGMPPIPNPIPKSDKT
ncbi:COR domain-containing protein [Candidatus Thiosymbion oneisti]|uniref:leucine-rich repeat domain-containing protein n=1 Tax=Candidatus Thiosymbion oneisti TaxID=589554 RepID=UPI000B0F8EF3|nr:COR domain-containing protein [Candidatus Thiosymbion oneisti]